MKFGTKKIQLLEIIKSNIYNANYQLITKHNIEL